ncbi:hypothetical protein INR00_26300, partial [Escherichia coli]|nr:hypothetical protein [Escherichia coli]
VTDGQRIQQADHIFTVTSRIAQAGTYGIHCTGVHNVRQLFTGHDHRGYFRQGVFELHGCRVVWPESLW